MMSGAKNPLHNCLRVAAALLLSPTLAGAQTACSLSDPGPRPAGNQIFYSVADGHGNLIPDFTQQSQSGSHNSSGNILPGIPFGSPAFNFWEAGLAKFGDLVSVTGSPSTEPLA